MIKMEQEIKIECGNFAWAVKENTREFLSAENGICVLDNKKQHCWNCKNYCEYGQNKIPNKYQIANEIKT